jgi:hypothetical protein
MHLIYQVPSAGGPACPSDGWRFLQAGIYGWVSISEVFKQLEDD